MKDDHENRRQYLAALKQRTDSYYQENIDPQRQKLSVEMILRKTFMDTLKEYAQNCSLAGVKKMIQPGICFWERIIRILVFFIALGTSGYFLLYIWSDTLTKPLIVTTQSSTYPIAKIDFPAIAVCNVNRISKKALQKLARQEYHDLAKHNEPIEEVEAVLLQWGRLLDFTYNDTLRKSHIYQNLVKKYLYNTERVIEIMAGLAPSCDEQLLQCAWDGDVVDCASIFTLKRTAIGHCCTFNYVLQYDGTENILKVNDKVKRQEQSGDIYGLTVILDPMVDDYAYSLSHTLGYDRNCLFNDEYKEVFGDSYSYSSCIVYCRVMAIRSLCKCTPYFTATGMFEGPICTLDSLRCLDKYKEKLSYLYPLDSEDTTGLEIEMQDSLLCADCYPDCELTSYSTKSYESSIINAYDTAKNMDNVFVDLINITNICFLSIFHPKSGATLNRLDVVNYWYEIVSSVGGFGGVVMGFSIISVVEIVFFCTVRFSHHLRRNYLEHH